MKFIIIGASPQINDNKGLIKTIIGKTYSISINDMCKMFNTDVNVHYDNIDYSKYKDNFRIEVKRGDYETVAFSITLAINYIKEYIKTNNIKNEEVYLIGIDHDLKGKHDYCIGYGKNAKKIDNKLELKVRNYIEGSGLNIYQTDYNSKGWNLPYKRIEDIINDK